MSILNPFDDVSAEVWSWVEKLNDFINTALNEPADLLGKTDWADTLFAQLWPLSNYLAVTISMVLLASIIMLWRRGIQYLPFAMISLVVTGIGATAIWNINKAMLGMQDKLIQALSSIGPSSIPPSITQSVPFPFMGEGFMPMIIYGLEVAFLAVLCAVVISVIFIAIVMGGGITVAFGVLPLGHVGRTIFRYAGGLWLVGYLAGLPTVALFRRLGQLAAYGLSDSTSEQILSTAIGFITVSMAIVMPYGFYRLGKMLNTWATGGSTKASVDGGVSATIENRPEVDITNSYSESLQPIDVSIVDNHTENKEGPGAMSKVAGVVEVGAVVLGQPEVAAVAKVAEAKVNND